MVRYIHTLPQTESVFKWLGDLGEWDMKRILYRKILIISVTVFILGLFGVIMQNRQNMVDDITGATSESEKKEHAEFSDEYILGINPNCGMNDELSEILYQAICGRADLKSFSDDTNIRILISEEDFALKRYMRSFETDMKNYGIDVDVMEYSNIMATSRVHSGKYDVFLLERSAVMEQDLENCLYFVIKGSEMG
jgi:hypothetical protein